MVVNTGLFNSGNSAIAPTYSSQQQQVSNENGDYNGQFLLYGSQDKRLPIIGNGMDLGALHSEQLEEKDRQIRTLAGTLQHYRNWANTIQARYQMFSPDVIRPAKRIYVGGLPAGTLDGELRQFLNELMVQAGGVVAAGFPITNCKVYADKNYSFVEFRSVEEASNCMAFDGVAFKDSFLRIRRPNNYDSNAALMLGPTEPNPTMDLSELQIVKTVVQDSPHKLFVGGLPCDWSEEQVKELLLPFGPLKAFNLVMDKNTGNSKGYAFCEYNDINLTDYVIQSLNGKPVGNKFLTVKRALAPPGPGAPAMAAGGVPRAAAPAGVVPAPMGAY